MKPQIYDSYEVEEELAIIERKRNYWRGFRACLVLVVAPVIITIIVLAQLWVNANI